MAPPVSTPFRGSLCGPPPPSRGFRRGWLLPLPPSLDAPWPPDSPSRGVGPSRTGVAASPRRRSWMVGPRSYYDYRFRPVKRTHHRPPASYAVRVPRIVALPAASFRPHLAVDALAVRLAVSAMWTCRGLEPTPDLPLGICGGVLNHNIIMFSLSYAIKLSYDCVFLCPVGIINQDSSVHPFEYE